MLTRKYTPGEIGIPVVGNLKVMPSFLIDFKTEIDPYESANRLENVASTVAKWYANHTNSPTYTNFAIRRTNPVFNPNGDSIYEIGIQISNSERRRDFILEINMEPGLNPESNEYLLTGAHNYLDHPQDGLEEVVKRTHNFHKFLCKLK